VRTDATKQSLRGRSAIPRRVQRFAPFGRSTVEASSATRAAAVELEPNSWDDILPEWVLGATNC
jgi:hypothetical protein